TVVIALVGLSVVNIPMLTKMGVAAAGTVAIAVLIALTMIPALLGYAGRRVRPAGEKSRLLGGGRTSGKPDRENRATRWARVVVRGAVAVLLPGVVGLGAPAVPAGSVELGLADAGSPTTSTAQRRADDLPAEGFGAGFNGPIVVVVDAEGSDDAQGA